MYATQLIATPSPHNSCRMEATVHTTAPLLLPSPTRRTKATLGSTLMFQNFSQTSVSEKGFQSKLFGALRMRCQAVRRNIATTQTSSDGLNQLRRNTDAPPLADTANKSTSPEPPQPQNKPQLPKKQKKRLSPPSTTPSLPKMLWKRLIRSLSSFPLAIGLLCLISALASLGTVIEQGESLETYMAYYPEDRPLFGFLTWRLLTGLALDHLYTSPIFLSSLALLAASLAACTAHRQWPLVKVAQRWQFFTRPEPILRLDSSDSLANARVADLATLLSAQGFQVFMREGRQLYAFKGLVGRFAPIGVHAALLLVMGGGLFSAIGGFRGSCMTPQGQGFYLGDVLNPNGVLSVPGREMNLRVQVEDFDIDYREDGQVKQFYSDLAMFDLDGKELTRKTISVNSPLRYSGVTLYQTDWAISAVQITVDDSDLPVNLPMAALHEPGSSQKLFGTFLPLGEEGVESWRGISILASDLQTVVLYDTKGQFVGVRRPGSNKPITVEGVKIVVEDLRGSTGLEVKMDPSVPYVYTGFGALMLTSAISFLSHAQVWAVEEGGNLYVGGKSNRAKLTFAQEFDDLLDLVPEVENTS